MAKRPEHPKKEVEEAVAYAEAKNWRWRKMGHWGRLFCQVGVNGTPRNASDHARQIKRAVDRCPHQTEAKDEKL